MKAMWKQRSTSRDWSAAYRGLTIRIKVDPESGDPTEISWYIGGVLSETSPGQLQPFGCPENRRQDRGYPNAENPNWAQAEHRYQRGLFLRR
jgi:hypothetical protein